MSAFEDEFADGSPRMPDARLAAALESMLLILDAPATPAVFADALDEPVDRVTAMLQTLSARFTAHGSGIDLRCTGDGWRLYTRTEYAPYVERLLQGGARSKLTKAALETLAVIAYRQPLTRARISAVRGVNVDGVVRTLLARGLIVEAGPDEETAAVTYATTELFLERLGLASLQDLPPLAPLLPDVDVIDDIAGIIEDDPRFATMDRTAQSTRSATPPDLEIDTEY
nr:SMC-Scp complex subunit ScpB [Prescottella subtropica]